MNPNDSDSFDPIPGLCAEAIASLVRSCRGGSYEAHRVVPFLAALLYPEGPALRFSELMALPGHLRRAVFTLLEGVDYVPPSRIAKEVKRLDASLIEILHANGVGQGIARGALTGLLAHMSDDPEPAALDAEPRRNLSAVLRPFLAWLSQDTRNPNGPDMAKLRELPAVVRKDAGTVFAAVLDGSLTAAQIREGLELGF